jgi:hypothetical protein
MLDSMYCMSTPDASVIDPDQQHGKGSPPPHAERPPDRPVLDAQPQGAKLSSTRQIGGIVCANWDIQVERRAGIASAVSAAQVSGSVRRDEPVPAGTAGAA